WIPGRKKSKPLLNSRLALGTLSLVLQPGWHQFGKPRMNRVICRQHLIADLVNDPAPDVIGLFIGKRMEGARRAPLQRGLMAAKLLEKPGILLGRANGEREFRFDRGTMLAVVELGLDVEKRAAD